jgi:uncharacterized membrane protein YphA (DoxX/SURF4 family)
MLSALLSLLAIPSRVFLGGVFIWAAYKKIFPLHTPNPPQVFSSSITAYKLDLPDWLVTFSTFAVPWTELVVGVTLILGLFTRASAAVIVSMLLLFIGLGYSAIARGLEIKCGCFGDGTLFCTGGLGWCHIRENLFLTSLGLLCVLARPWLAADQIVNRRAL